MTDSRPVSPPSELTAEYDGLCSDHPCIWCGGLMLMCGEPERCCPECDHPYSIRELVIALDAARAAPQADVSMSESCFTLGCYVTRSPDGYNPGLAPQADANLEGYWERAYWEIVPKLAAALDAAPQADAGTLREALSEMLGMWEMRWSIDPGIVKRRGATVRKARAALAASSPATAGRDVEMHETPNFPGFAHVAGSEPEICMACRIEAETS